MAVIILDNELIRCAQEFVLTVIGSTQLSPGDIWNHNLNMVAERVFSACSETITIRFIDSLIKALHAHTLYQFDSNAIAIAICKNHPLVLLERLSPAGEAINEELSDVLNEQRHMKNLPLTTLPPDLVFEVV